MPRKRRRRTPRRAWLLLPLALVALALLGARHLWTRAAPADAPATAISIPRGASLRTAAERLERAQLIPSADAFVVAARVLGRDAPVQYGEYRVARGSGWGRILARLQSGDVVSYRLTIPEGWPSILVAERLRAEPMLTGKVAVPAEGSVLPDTYDFQRGETRAAVLGRMRKLMARTLAAEWKARKPTAAVKTSAEAIILASIVEKETGKPSERRMVAGVYSNRLRIGMKLDADPTVIYPITAGKPLGRRIRRSELQRDTGYNTYLKPGLPKGPIANPGRASIAAVLDPAPTKALYFVADGTGGHVFATTLAQQNANVSKWFALRRQRGEM